MSIEVVAVFFCIYLELLYIAFSSPYSKEYYITSVEFNISESLEWGN